MTIAVPSQEQRLAFVPNAQYSDAIDAVRGGAFHISSLLPAISDVLGAPVTTQVHRDAHALRCALQLPEANAVIVVLVDGLGFYNLSMRLAHAAFLRALMKEPINQRPISTCSPSTTAAAMAVFGTGTCPGLTGMAGYTQYNPQRDCMSQLISFRDAIPAQQLQVQPTVFEMLEQQGVRVTNVGLSKFLSSPLTRAAFRGAHYVCADKPLDRIKKAAHSANEPGLTYLYLRDVDKIGHAKGWDSPDWISTYERIDEQLSVLHRLSPQGTLIVITADHGMVRADPALRIDIAQEPKLCEGVRAIGGEPRNVMVYAKDGVDPQLIAQRYHERLGDLAWVRTKQEALDSALFGPVRDDVVPMLGDVIVSAAGEATLVDSRIQQDKATRLPGVHGSQTMQEMDIPCIVDLV